MLTLLLPPLPRLRRDPELRSLLDPVLARGDRLDDLPEGRTAQLARLFDKDPLPVAALTRSVDSPSQADALWLRADPAHLMVDMAAVRMMACGDLGVGEDERIALERDLAELFAGEGLAFDAPSPRRWYLRLPDDADLPDFHPPEAALGADLEDWLPQGGARAHWRRLLNETQVLLHQHPVNDARARRGVPALNSLWFWGAGRMPESVQTPFDWVASEDPLLRALAQCAGIGFGGGGRGLIDLHAADARAIATAIGHAAARAELHFADGLRFRIASWQRLRIWRRRAADIEGTP